ncbi:putative 3-oxoacyl-[acyl-carrier-protein] reductase [Streptomyces sp. Tu6071]|nr:putative 3-oxoacyl-[acyl-carrier-protein] reductase [Streptomyces sp. Tu6071]
MGHARRLERRRRPPGGGERPRHQARLRAAARRGPHRAAGPRPGAHARRTGRGPPRLSARSPPRPARVERASSRPGDVRRGGDVPMTEQSTTLAAPAHAERTGAADEGAGTPPGALAERAGALAALAAGHARRGEEERGLTGEVVAGIVAAGFARHFVPAAHGGAEGGFGGLAEAVLRLGTGCTSAAWAASLSAYAGRYAAYLPEEGQAEGGEAEADRAGEVARAVVRARLHLQVLHLRARRERRRRGGREGDAADVREPGGPLGGDVFVHGGAVGDDALDAGAARCRLLDGTRDRLGVAGAGHHGIAARDERLGDSEADAPGRAGHESGSPGGACLPGAGVRSCCGHDGLPPRRGGVGGDAAVLVPASRRSLEGGSRGRRATARRLAGTGQTPSGRLP